MQIPRFWKRPGFRIVALVAVVAWVTGFFTLLLPKRREAREIALRVPHTDNFRNLSRTIYTRPVVDSK